jgi:hypothetical protein
MAANSSAAATNQGARRSASERVAVGMTAHPITRRDVHRRTASNRQ